MPGVWKKILWGVGILVLLFIVVDYVQLRVHLNRNLEKLTKKSEVVAQVGKTEASQPAPAAVPAQPVASPPPVAVAVPPAPIPIPKEPIAPLDGLEQGGGAPQGAKQTPLQIPPEIAALIPPVAPSSSFNTPAQPKHANPQEAGAAREKENQLVVMALASEEYPIARKIQLYLPAEKRAEAVAELANYPYGRVAKALANIVSMDSQPVVRFEAIKSLGSVADSNFMPFLDGIASTDPDPNMREAAKQALEQIKSRANQPRG